MSYVVWILVRSLTMFLQICVNWMPDRKFHIATTVAAFSIIISLTAATLAHTGVSYRFGGYCHINVRSLATYWGWLFGFGGTACLLQIATMLYCIKVYMSSAWNRRHDPSTMSQSIVGSSRTQTVRAQARRVRQVLLLQWRSLTLAFLAVFTTAFVCIVFMIYDNNLTIEAFNNVDTLIPWILCLIENQSTDKCIYLTGPIILPEDLAIAALFILGFVGIEAFFLLCRWDVFTAWWTMLRTPLGKRNNSSVSNFMGQDDRVEANGEKGEPESWQNTPVVDNIPATAGHGERT